MVTTQICCYWAPGHSMQQVIRVNADVDSRSSELLQVPQYAHWAASMPASSRSIHAMCGDSTDLQHIGVV